MKQTRDSVWQRRGTSWLWDDEALAQVGIASQVWSLRQFLQIVGKWSDELPSNDGNTLIVAGLDASLDLLLPEDAEDWLGSLVKDAILSFQAYFEGQASLIFWLPSGANRINVNPATDAVTWRCSAPYAENRIDFGRVLWGEAREYPQEILLRDGAKSSGLFHLRIT